MLQSILDEESKNIEAQTIETIPRKRPKLNEASSTSTLFDEFQDSSGEEEVDTIDNEIETYIRRKIEPNTCLLEFWKNCNDLGLLKKLARRVLNVPASSATSERLFSTSGRILEERRTRLL
ncbi:hAT family C-terminal dimerization region, partial [Popillia japonica]